MTFYIWLFNWHSNPYISFYCCSVAKLCLTLWHPMNCSTPGFSFFHYLPESESHSVMSDSLWPHGLYSPWNSPGQSTGVGSRSLTPGDLPRISHSIFPSIKVFSNESVLCTVGEGKYQDDVINFCQRNFVGWWKSRTVYFYILLEKLNIGII